MFKVAHKRERESIESVQARRWGPAGRYRFKSRFAREHFRACLTARNLINLGLYSGELCGYDRCVGRCEQPTHEESYEVCDGESR